MAKQKPFFSNNATGVCVGGGGGGGHFIIGNKSYQMALISDIGDGHNTI